MRERLSAASVSGSTAGSSAQKPFSQELRVEDKRSQSFQLDLTSKCYKISISRALERGDSENGRESEVHLVASVQINTNDNVNCVAS